MTAAIADFERIGPGEAGGGGSFRAVAPDRLGRPGETVVVHLLGPLTDQQLGRLRPLLVTLAGIRSPHMVALIDAGFRIDGAERGGWYATADPGGSDLTGPRPEPEALRAVADAARGVHALHEVGVAHGAICAEAVRVGGPTGPAAVIDLPPLDPGRTTAGLVWKIGEPGCLDPMDPTVAAGAPTSRASDIWALGATLHRAITGRLLHPDLVGDPAVVALQRVMFEPVAMADGLEPAVGATLASCLARDPRDRPPSAAALALHLDSLADAR